MFKRFLKKKGNILSVSTCIAVALVFLCFASADAADNNAKNLNDLRIPPANNLEKLKRDREGQYSVRINDQWRICFNWEDGDAYGVEITDYH